MKRSALALVVLAAALVLPAQALASSPNGSAGEMPAFYDGHLFTINFKQEPSAGEASLLAHNGSINTIYMSDQAEAAGFIFTSVLDAIQGDGFNPLWQEVQIIFKTIPPPAVPLRQPDPCRGRGRAHRAHADNGALPLRGCRQQVT